jgi:hypothetical protein
MPVKKAPEFHLYHSKDRFSDDAPAHLALPFLAIGENHRNFLHIEAQQPRFELHFDLEGIANELDLIKSDSI